MKPDDRIRKLQDELVRLESNSYRPKINYVNILLFAIIIFAIFFSIALNVPQYIGLAAIQFEDLEANSSLKDHGNNKIDGQINVKDKKFIETLLTADFSDPKNLKRRDVEIIPDDSVIKSIELFDFYINDSQETILLIDDINESGKFANHVEIYAIDPTMSDFTEAHVTVTAKGTHLYKCKDWIFETQECNGTWVKLMDIVPGENYTFTLSASDPAFSEIVDIQDCDAEDFATQGSFADACDFPSGSALAADGGNVETHTYGKTTNQYGGVRISQYDSSITTCTNITKVDLCYEWWGSFTSQDCDVSVDADGGVSYTAVTTDCPGLVAQPGITCVDVTLNESWTCDSFLMLVEQNPLLNLNYIGQVRLPRQQKLQHGMFYFLM